MAPTLLKKGVNFKARTNLKGFNEYVMKRGLVQNKGVYMDMSPHKRLGYDSELMARHDIELGSFVNYWIAAPRASTDTWRLQGRFGDDFIQGTDAGENDIRGMAGDDYLHGSANHPDRLSGGDGNDNIYGYKGDDTIFADEGSDVLVGGQGDDSLFGDHGNDRLFRAKGNDILRGGPGDDLLMGGPGINTLAGGQGADRFALLKSAENLIFDFDPFEGDQLLIRRKDMAKLKFLQQGGFFVLDFGQSTTLILSRKALTDAIIMDAIILRS